MKRDEPNIREADGRAGQVSRPVIGLLVFGMTFLGAFFGTFTAGVQSGAVVEEASALDLRVRGRSHLSTDVRTAGTRLMVTGVLRDDLQNPLPQRTIVIAVDKIEESETRQVAQQSLVTSRRGTFSARFDLAPGEYDVRAEFEQTSHVSGSMVGRSVTVAPKPVKLSLRAPRFVAAPLSENQQPMLNAAVDVGGTGVDVPLQLKVAGEQVSNVDLNEMGRARVDLSPHLESGENTIEAVVPEGEYREATRQLVVVRKSEDLRVTGTFEEVFERLQRGVAVSGVVRDSHGPIRNVGVEIRVAPLDDKTEETARGEDQSGAEGDEKSASELRRVKTVPTDGNGRFRAFFDAEVVSDGRWGARAKVIPDVGDPSSFTIGTLAIDRSLGRWIVNGAGALAGLVLLLVGGRFVWGRVSEQLEERRQAREELRRQKQAFEREEELAPVALDEERDDIDSPGFAFGGVVRDVWRDEALTGARLALRRDGEDVVTTTSGADGRFVFEALEEGDYRVAVDAPGFITGRFGLEIPHGGDLAHVRLDLVAVPLKIRRLYQSLVQTLEGEDLWGQLSPRDIEGTLREHLEEWEADEAHSLRPRFVREVRAMLDAAERGDERPTSREYLEALTDIVEETYFSRGTYDEEVWELARRLAVTLRNEIRNE